jgi:transcriptional regulator with XRE-family HTH domain
LFRETERWRAQTDCADKYRQTRTLAQAFGAELTRLRLANCWSQQKLAEALGYTERYIGQLERGVKSPLRTIADIAQAFSTKPSAILRAAESRQDRAAKRRSVV